MTVLAPPMPRVKIDPRIAAFVNPQGPAVFSGIVHGNQIGTPDPFDVESIHSEARERFAGLVHRASATTPPTHGKSLLLLGEAGSGKTHLIRAFRNRVHEEGSGYCGYLQMTTRTDNYARYVLANLIDGLEQPYLPGKPSGLARLALGLLDALDELPLADRERFRHDPGLQPTQLAEMVERFADFAIQTDRFKSLDVDVIRGLLWLLSNDARIHPRALKWLRCEDISDYDRKMLGGIVPRSHAESPLRTIIDLGKLMYAVNGSALVIFVDQIEEILADARPGEERGATFRLGVNTLIDIADAVPTAVVVIACLEDHFDLNHGIISKPKLDRLVQDPAPIRLSSRRSLEDIRRMAAQRLGFLFESLKVALDPTDPIFPFSDTQLSPLTAMGPREILHYLRLHHEACIQRGEWFEPSAGRSEIIPSKESPKTLDWEQTWNDYRNASQSAILEDEPKLADLLGWSIKTVSAEMPDGLYFGTTSDGRFLETDVHLPDNHHQKLLVAICDRSTRGGGLGVQVNEVAQRAGELPAVLVRSTQFPTDAKTVVAKKIVELIAPKGKGRRAVVENSEWRTMQSMRTFHGAHQGEAGFAAWQKESKPLSQLASIGKILDLDKLLTTPIPPAKPSASLGEPLPPAGSPKPVLPPPPSVEPVAAGAGSLLLGRSRSALPQTIAMEPKELCRHMAFLGGSGSGKTTAALNLIEQLLLRGVPAVLVDRKGDLCRYADPAAWLPSGDAAATARRKELRERIDVAVYTPGSIEGRPLALPVVPVGLSQLPSAEREQLAGYAAASLGGMIGFRTKGQDPRLAILSKAIDVLARIPGQEVTLPALKKLIADQDDALVIEVEGYDDRHFKKLAEDLLTLNLTRKALFENGPALDVDELLGRAGHAKPGKTRLSIINTQSLGDAAITDFWVAQFLVAVGRWTSKNPADHLQAVLMFDEADQYLPATRQPATKPPMEHLLKRARSAGVGIFLATQSPGDLDYRCRDQVRSWLIGRVRESTAINKLKPMLEAGNVDATSKLPDQATGEFYLVRDSDVVALKTEPSLIATHQLPIDRIIALAKDPPQ